MVWLIRWAKIQIKFLCQHICRTSGLIHRKAQVTCSKTFHSLVVLTVLLIFGDSTNKVQIRICLFCMGKWNNTRYLPYIGIRAVKVEFVFGTILALFFYGITLHTRAVKLIIEKQWKQNRTRSSYFLLRIWIKIRFKIFNNVRCLCSTSFYKHHAIFVY